MLFCQLMTRTRRVSGLLLLALLLTRIGIAQPVGKSPRSTAYEQFVRATRQPLKAPTTICYKSNRDEFTRVLPPETFLKNYNNPGARRAAATSTFIVTYTGFTAEAQKAFQYAVDIWSSIIVSPVPIRIKAEWVSLSPGILGSAGPAEIRLASDGTQKGRGIYPIALAEKIARRPLNNPDSSDINARFSRNNNWYFGLDGKTPANQTDLVTVVLHEIGHGLGFIGYYATTGTTADFVTNFPAVYDHFIENGAGEKLVSSTDKYPIGSNALYRQLTGGNLFINGPVLQQKAKTKARIYAPSVFDRGSSIYHLDEATYLAKDTNSLMTPQIGNAEAIHTPGPLVINFFADMEWKTTSVLHEPLVSSEDVKDVVFRTRVVSDTTLVPNSIKLFYRKGPPTSTDNTFTSVSPALVAGTTDTYTYTMPAATATGDIWYYFQAQDASGRTFTNPGKSPADAQLLHRVQFGPDNVPPVIQFNQPKNFIINPAVADSLVVRAFIADDRITGVDTAYVEYQVNGVARPALPLRFTQPVVDGIQYDSIYTGRVVFPANSLKAGDKIAYRVVAFDSSRARNQVVSPKTGFYELSVVAPLAVRDRYTNTFADQATASDFAGYRFGLATPAGFTDPAIHSEHPYQNGTDFRYQANAEYVLLAPIRLKTSPDSATIRFNEIVLVEPGDAGSTFGSDNFYDYVIVEGSTDFGRTWKPFIDGYDSRDQADWLAAYNRSTQTNQTTGETNSTTVGTPTLYKPREIFLQSSGFFRANDQVLIRFRLFSDQLAHGWGWAIDNLQIQVPPPPPVLAAEPVSSGTFTVYPNPVTTTGLMRIEAVLAKSVSAAGLTIAGPTGQTLRQQTLKVSGTKISEQLDLTGLPSGLYFLKLSTGDATLTQKVIIAR
ncbi:T9SS type A sorting domain-containing protein [Spirosoma luteolum]